MTQCPHTDNWYTKEELYEYICHLVNIYPLLDICASKKSTKCINYFTKEYNSLEHDWIVPSYGKVLDIWCNAPGRYIQKFINKAHEQWLKKNMNIVMLIPVNTITNKEFETIWNLFLTKQVEIHPLFGIRPKFLDGRLEQFEPVEPKMGSRNGYIVLVFRKRNNYIDW